VVADSKHHRHLVVAHHEPRHAYPMDIFLMHPPEFERDPLPPDAARKIARAFDEGHADEYAARTLVRAGVVSYHPLHGGIFWRREPVKYIILHSTETGIPMGAVRVIESWGSAGRRHAGAQYVVDRDGTIYQACDPDLATVHVNVFKTLPGINNDNSIGIEMCHAGHQDYPPEQRQSVTRLVTYLQDRYKVVEANVVTHRYAQQGDHTDPVYFDFDEFLASKDHFRNQAIAYRVDRIKQDGASWKAVPAEAPTTVDEAVTSTVESQQGGVLPFVHHESTARSIPAVISNPPSAKGENPSTPALRGPIEMEPGFVQRSPVKQAPVQTTSPAVPVQNIVLPAPNNAPPAVTTPPAGSVVPVKPASLAPSASPPAVPIQNVAPQTVPGPSSPDGRTPEDTRFFVQPPSVP
jgi:hypothetical protein